MDYDTACEILGNAVLGRWFREGKDDPGEFPEFQEYGALFGILKPNPVNIEWIPSRMEEPRIRYGGVPIKRQQEAIDWWVGYYRGPRRKS